MGHTKGPYIVQDCSDAFAEKFTIERVTDGLRSVLCRINDMEVCPEHGGTGSQANAHLFAAAPDLLAALEEFIACGPNAGHNQDLISQARAAIAKATQGRHT